MKFIKIITLGSLFWASMGFGVGGIGDDNTSPEEEKKYLEEPEGEEVESGQGNENSSEATSKQDDSASTKRTKKNIKALEATIKQFNGKITSREHSLKNLNNALYGLPGSRQSLMQRVSELERILQMNEVNFAESIIDRLNRIGERINTVATLTEMLPPRQSKLNSAGNSKKIDRDQLEKEIKPIREEANAIRQENEALDALERDSPHEIHQIEQELATLTLNRGVIERLLAQIREELKKTSPKQTTAITSTTDTCAAVCPELTPEEREALRQQQLKEAKAAYIARQTARPNNQATPSSPSNNGVLSRIDPINGAMILILMLLLASYGVV